MKLYLIVAILFFLITPTFSQTAPSFNSKALIDVTTISSWNFTQRPAGWYRIARISGGFRGNATFEIRENADHSTLRFELGINFNSSGGSSFTITNHSFFSQVTFPKIRLLTEDTYSDVFLEIYVDPHNNDNQSFYAYLINALADGDWTLINWIPGSVPSGYVVTEFNTNQLLGSGNITNPNAFSVQRNGNIGIGTTTPREKLSVNGKIRAQEIKVEVANWPDYVFEDKYQPSSLTDLETFIKTNKHLPGIPSAKEVAKDGINLGEMNAKLLKKIEELTLYIIDLKKEVETLKAN